MVHTQPALTREQVQAEIDTFENFHAPYGVPDLYPRALLLIDKVAAHISNARGHLPDICADHLHDATLAATRNDIPKMVTYLGFALFLI